MKEYFNKTEPLEKVDSLVEGNKPVEPSWWSLRKSPQWAIDALQLDQNDPAYEKLLKQIGELGIQMRDGSGYRLKSS